MPLGLTAARRVVAASALSGAPRHETFGGTRKRRLRIDEVEADVHADDALLDIASGRERPGPPVQKARRLMASGGGTPVSNEMASIRPENGRIKERDWHR